VVEEETEVDSVEVVEVGILVLAVVEVGVVAVVVVAVGILEEAVATMEAVAVIMEAVVAIMEEVVVISEEAAEISEVEEVVEASTVVEVEVALGNREGAWPLLSSFPSNLIWNAAYLQRTSRQPWTFVLRISPKMSL